MSSLCKRRTGLDRVFIFRNLFLSNNEMESMSPDLGLPMGQEKAILVVPVSHLSLTCSNAIHVFNVLALQGNASAV